MTRVTRSQKGPLEDKQRLSLVERQRREEQARLRKTAPGTPSLPSAKIDTLTPKSPTPGKHGPAKNPASILKVKSITFDTPPGIHGASKQEKKEGVGTPLEKKEGARNLTAPSHQHSNKAPSHEQSNKAIFKSFFLPIENATADHYRQIGCKLKHPLMKRFVDDNSAEFQLMPAPGIMPNWIDRYVFQRLSLDPESAKDDKDVFASYAIIDLCSQWIFRGPTANSSQMYACPARMFELLSKERRKSKGKDVNAVLEHCLDETLLSTGPQGFFSKKVIDVPIYDGSHFSWAFIVNANTIITRAVWKPDKDDSAPMPAILYCNSLKNNKIHNPDHAAEVLRFFLNAVDKKLHGSAGTAFTKKTIPVYQAEGMFCCVTAVCCVPSVCCDKLSHCYKQFSSNVMATVVVIKDY